MAGDGNLDAMQDQAICERALEKARGRLAELKSPKKTPLELVKKK